MVPKLWPGVLLKKSNHYAAAMAAVVLDKRSSGNLPILGSGCSGISNWEMQRPCLEREFKGQSSIFLDLPCLEEKEEQSNCQHCLICRG